MNKNNETKFTTNFLCYKYSYFIKELLYSYTLLITITITYNSLTTIINIKININFDTIYNACQACQKAAITHRSNARISHHFDTISNASKASITYDIAPQTNAINVAASWSIFKYYSSFSILTPLNRHISHS